MRGVDGDRSTVIGCPLGLADPPAGGSGSGQPRRRWPGRTRAAGRRLSEQEAADGGRQAQRSRQGEPVRGRIPAGRTGWPRPKRTWPGRSRDASGQTRPRTPLIAAGEEADGAPTGAHGRQLRVVRRARAGRRARCPGRARADRHGPRDRGGKKLPKTVANITDPQSRLMPTRRGFLQGYNAQVAVTSDQMIVAVQVGQSPNDMAASRR